MKKIIAIGIVMVLMISGFFIFKVEEEEVVNKISNKDTKTERFDVDSVADSDEIFEKYTEMYEPIKGTIFYVLIGESFEKKDDVSYFNRHYVEFRDDGAYPQGVSCVFDNVESIEDLRSRKLELFDYDLGGGLNLNENTIVSEEILKQWKEEGYDGEGSYWEKSPKGLTYEELRSRNSKLDKIYKKYESKYEAIEGITFYVLIGESFGKSPSIKSEIECFKRLYIVFADGHSYPLDEVIVYDNVHSIDDVRRKNLKEFDYDSGGGIGLNKNTIISEEILKQWREEGYDGEGSFWEKSPKGLSYEDLNEISKKSENVYVLKFMNGERIFESEVIPKSDGEKVILDSFKNSINDEFKNVFSDKRGYNNYPKIYSEKAANGLYTEEVIVHSMRTLNEEEYTNKDNGLKYYPYMKRLEKYKPFEFEVIEVNYTNRLTEEYNKVAQWGSGNWTRYFVIVRRYEDSEWKIFGIYGHM